MTSGGGKGGGGKGGGGKGGKDSCKSSKSDPGKSKCAKLNKKINDDQAISNSLKLVFEIGVGLCVAAVLFTAYQLFSRMKK
jgi:hypothetical protein